MVSASARLVGALLALVAGAQVFAQPQSDPVYDGKKSSEWVVVLQNDPSARKRALAIVALGSAWSEHQYKDGLRNVGRSLRTDTSAAVRAQAATTIAGFKPDAVREIDNELIKALDAEKDPRVRKELALAIARFPEVAKKAVEQLSGALKDADPATRFAAADALFRVLGRRRNPYRRSNSALATTG